MGTVAAHGLRKSFGEVQALDGVTLDVPDGSFFVSVGDGASFTTAGYQNPTITIAALSMRACEYIADQRRQGTL